MVESQAVELEDCWEEGQNMPGDGDEFQECWMGLSTVDLWLGDGQ